MRIGLATLVAGRREQLARQARAVTALNGVDEYVVMAMDDAPVDVVGVSVRRVAPGDGGLPLAAARNLAIDALFGCDLAILLDVDCIPGPELVDLYRAASAALPDAAGLLCGPVGYLADGVADAIGDGELTPAARADARRRVIRAFPAAGIARQSRPELFWSLSFAVTPNTHARIGGFDETYAGYGAEDTDYGLRAAAAGVGLWFVAGAWAYHQPHPPSPPRRLGEVVANARRFHARWGFWPMPDALRRATEAGHIRWTPSGTACELV